MFAFTRNDGHATLRPFLHAPTALSDHGLQHRTLASALRRLAAAPPAQVRHTTIVHAWGTDRTAGVEAALAASPPPPRPRPPALTHEASLADIAAAISSGEQPELGWLVHESGHLDFRVRTAPGQPWRTAMRSRDIPRISAALADHGIAAAVTPAGASADRQTIIRELNELQETGRNRWMEIYQARQR